MDRGQEKPLAENALKLHAAVEPSGPEGAASEQSDIADLVRRAQSASDRRANHLELTAEGESLAQEATRRLIEGEAEILAARLTPGERGILLELLHKVALCRTA